MSLVAVERLTKEFPVAVVCKALGRSRSALYAARARKKLGTSAKEQERRRLRPAARQDIV